MAATFPDIDEDFCYITTTGRRTGRPHRVEMWFAGAPGGRTIYALAGGRDRCDWVRNVVADPRCTVRIGAREGAATGRVVAPDTEEDAQARRLVLAKYAGPGETGLDRWGRTALPVAFDLSYGP